MRNYRLFEVKVTDLRNPPEIGEPKSFYTTIDGDKEAYQILTSSKIAALLKESEFEFEKGEILGTVIEIESDHEKPYLIVGHEGSSCGNIKRIEEFEIEWRELGI
ncbi:hypothetical protein [Acinetobacter sp. P1(2025)]|uniref:hypothetical protein n=1 Tax=Acinetobacter sp. P1(2025) TaxID=3446120 RepID=UPI003F52AA68